MPLCCSIAAITDEASSGIDVPNATNVRPITNSETPSFCATDAADLTKKSEPLASKTKPSTSNTTLINTISRYTIYKNKKNKKG